jgi:hypothetical protein
VQSDGVHAIRRMEKFADGRHARGQLSGDLAMVPCVPVQACHCQVSAQDGRISPDPLPESHRLHRSFDQGWGVSTDMATMALRRV